MSDKNSEKIVKNAWGDMSDRSDIGDNFVHLSPYRIGDRSDICDSFLLESSPNDELCFI